MSNFEIKRLRKLARAATVALAAATVPEVRATEPTPTEPTEQQAMTENPRVSEALEQLANYPKTVDELSVRSWNTPEEFVAACASLSTRIDDALHIVQTTDNWEMDYRERYMEALRLAIEAQEHLFSVEKYYYSSHPDAQDSRSVYTSSLLSTYRTTLEYLKQEVLPIDRIRQSAAQADELLHTEFASPEELRSVQKGIRDSAFTELHRTKLNMEYIGGTSEKYAQVLREYSRVLRILAAGGDAYLVSHPVTGKWVYQLRDIYMKEEAREMGTAWQNSASTEHAKELCKKILAEGTLVTGPDGNLRREMEILLSEDRVFFSTPEEDQQALDAYVARVVEKYPEYAKQPETQQHHH